MTMLETSEVEAPPIPQITVIVPTYNEAGNVAELASRLAAAIRPDVPFEVVFVDDSTDDTPQVIEAVAREHGLPLSVLHREEPVGGLGGAVVEGLRMARADWVVVIDGDLQHPPELVPSLVVEGRRAAADLVVATRYADGGSGDGLANGYRKLVSRSSTIFTRLVFPRSLKPVSDPMSGFFAVRRSCLDVDELRPIGFKIMLELIVRSRPGRIVEVPYEFRERFAGESKSSLRQGVHFLRHLAALRLGDSALVRTIAFGTVGLSGFIPNLLVLWLLTSIGGLHYAVAAVLSTQVAIVWNFILLDLFVFTGKHRWGVRGRFGSFLLLNNVDLLLRIPLLALLVERFGFGILTGTVVTLVAAFGFRFLVTERLVYLARRPKIVAMLDLTAEAR
jgi:dolichol-phosphate mannosyltransferase